MWHLWGSRKIHGVLWGNLKEGDHLEDLGLDIIKMSLMCVGRALTGFIWLRVRTSGRLL